jgi:hypothetical protein
LAKIDPIVELHPFTQERLNDLEIDFRRHETDYGQAAAAKLESRLAKLEDKPELSIEGVDSRLKNLTRELQEHVEGAITLKKVRIVVEDAIEAQ